MSILQSVGLLLESPNQRAGGENRVLLTIDLTTKVVSEALAKDTSVIVAYHPPIFSGLKSLTLSNPLQSSLLQCAAKGISIYSPHTALDSVWGGINDWLAEGLLSKKQDDVISALVAEKIGANGVSEGAEGRLVTLKEAIPMAVLAHRVKSHLRLTHLQVGINSLDESRSSSVRTIAISAGSGGSMLAGKKADVYLTGEMSHHEVLAALAAGTNVILCGHTNTERGYLPLLAAKLLQELRTAGEGAEDVEVVRSTPPKIDDFS
ncbi:uncharacterized protein LACBIDRAFT_333500 [Laccaria bicolor S238N-H82]|uniref:Predicted protein n=1 Tax=Laccaria bicolor (strain S238N-H82 / ATCC MYA-4686) TaxID=486041 RepID=B0DW41_LACBS|nr:uncharacterized protein LACBIDRAFT_333500 [Laccaria bicolor S238N-H82]EDR01112.1 predicted protein [Laccaria bicolor S238N-H82]|eukprot:XP_001888154.1 predicted protein [Laccaria bicolor S238N-H82]